MPAPKRGSASPELQPKIRKLDEDEEALSATIESTTISLKSENKQENTAAAPLIKKKRLAVELGNTPDKSSNQSSPAEVPSNTTPDPPVKKAKLLNATSASCEEIPSQRANSKVSLKRTTSAESDEDLSSDGSKVDFFREKDDEDKACCIRIYSNKVKAMCRAEESSSDPQEMSQDLPSSPSGPVQIDHNYGRFSESTSLENTGEVEDKDSAGSFTEERSKEISHDETQKVPTDTLVSEIGSTETSVKIDSATEKGKHVELQYPESQTLVDNETPASSREMADCVVPVGEENEKQDETEFIKSQKDVDNTLALPEKTLCAVTGELHSSGEGSQLVDERTDSVCRSASQTHLITQFVSEENEQNIKTKEHEVSETAKICAEKLDGVLLNKTNSAPEQVEISKAEGRPEENVKMSEFVTISNTQMDLNDQVASKEEFNATNLQAEMSDTVVSSCENSNKTLEKSDKFEGSARDGADFQSPQTSACSEALVEVHLNHGIVTPDSCTDTSSECVVVQNQIEMLSDNFNVPEGQTPEVVVQSEEDCPIYDKVTKLAAETERDSSDIGREKDKSVQCSAAGIKMDAQTSHPDATGKTQNQDACEATTDFHEAHGADNFKTMENEDTVDAECMSEAETVVTSEISNSEPPVEKQMQEIQEVSESTTVTSTEMHGSVIADKCENMKTVECAVIAEGQRGMDTVASFKLFDPEAKVELQIQESPVNEHTAVVPDESQEDPENANSTVRNDVECVDITAENLIEVDIQTAAMSEEVCRQMQETHSQMNEEVSECTIDICATHSQTEYDVLSASTSEDISNIAHTEEIQTPTASEPTTDMNDDAQKELENANCAAQSQSEVVEDVQAAATSAKVSNFASIEEMQTSMVIEPTTDAPDDAHTDLEDAAFKSSRDIKCVSAVAQSQIEVVVDTSASEKVSNVAPVEAIQSQTVSEPTTDTSVEVFVNHREEKLKTVENTEFKCESPAVTLNQMEVETTLSMKNTNPALLLGVNKRQTEEVMQAPDNSSSTAFVVETQTQKIQDVSGQTTDDTKKELFEGTMVKILQNVKNEDEVNPELVIVQEDQRESKMQITSDSVLSGADHAEEIQKSPNEMDMLTVTTSEQDCNVPAAEIQNLKSHDVNEENLQSVADEESPNKMETMETSFSPPSLETQNQRSFNITESSTNVSEQVQENLRTSTSESLENENKAIEECVSANKMEIQAAERLQENSQPTTVKQIESQRGQEVSELTTDANISVSPTSSATQIQTSSSVSDPENDASEADQESFSFPKNECHEYENTVIKESVGTAEWANKMETQTAEMLEEVSQPTVTEQTQSQRALEVSELTTDANVSILPPSPEAQIQRSFDIAEPASEVCKTVQDSFKSPSNECHENDMSIQECVDTDEMANKMKTQTAKILEEVSLPTTTEQTQNQSGQELSELTTDTDISVLSPSSEVQIQKSLIVESAVNVSETVQKIFRITSNESHDNENEIVGKSVDTSERTNEMETQAAEILLEVSQPATTDKRQNLSGQEVSELTTDTNISVSPSSSETQIQKSSSVTNSANDAPETVQESFRIPSNELHENENTVIKECADTSERTHKMEIHTVQMLEEASEPTFTEQTQTLSDQEVSEVTTDICVSPASAETQFHISLDISEATTNISETVQEDFQIPLNECHENEKRAIEEFADTAEMTNEMEIQTTEAVEEIFQPTTTEQTQNLKGQEVSELTINTDISVTPPSTEAEVEKRINVTEPRNDLSKTVQEHFKIPPTETNENENEAIEKCADTAEMMNEMEIQTEAAVDLFQPTTTEQTQNQKGQEVLTIITDASVSSPSAETQIQKISITEPTNDLSTTDQENIKIPPNETNEDENEAIEERVHGAERTNEMETQPAELLQEIFPPTITEQSQNQRNQEFCELTTDTEVENNSVNTESEENKNSASAFENHSKVAIQISSTPEFYYQTFDVEPQNQQNEEVSEARKMEDEDASECENVPEIETNTEFSAESKYFFYPTSEQQNHLAKETTEHTTNLSDENQTSCPVVNLENKENDRRTEPENVVWESKERIEPALEEAIKVDASVNNTEGGGAERSEVIVFVCDQSEDTNVAVQAPEGQIKMVTQSEVDFHENQVVYEPISSPESNSGGEVCTIQLGETISFLDLHSTETHQILGEESNFLTSDNKLKTTHPKLVDEEIGKKEICASDSQAIVLMEVETTSEAQCLAHARLEQSDTTEDVKRISAIRSSDISLADGQSRDATEKSERRGILECSSAAELTEQVQEDSGVQDATSIVVTTAPPPTEVEITDASSEDYVILEPVSVPESEIHFDIVTQAAAESGLSASLGPDEEMTSQSILSSSQQTVVLEAEAHQGETTDEVKETTVTSSGDVLEQETETNGLQEAPVSDHQPPSATVDVDMANFDHTNKDSNAAMMENVETIVDQEQVQILEDMEIGREIVVAEEDNEGDGDVIIITKPPDQPNEGSSKKSAEEVNDEKKQYTIKAVEISAETNEGEKKKQEAEKPKKQEMNMQARTKARLAALAEQKAAAAKRSANRQQLNLLALCQEIAEDIATDSMLLKKIEEEKQAAAEAAKAEAIKKEPPAVIPQEAEPEPDNVATPAGPEESSASVAPTPEPPAVQPSTADSAEMKPAAEPPKRRFFISQISVPLKAHEKKKLTRYQRLRQVELQREKMSWARVKKLKSDQTNQMFSDVDWQASFSGSFLMSSTTPPPTAAAAASPSKTPPVSPATTTQPARPKEDSPKTETSTSEPMKTAADKPESTETEKSESEPVKTETTKTEPTKTETSKAEIAKTETSKAEPVKADATKTEAPISENRRITRQSKAQASQATAVAPKPAPKVTRSTSKRTLPAVPPPMPNGLNAQKQKPVEYKPYRPRPKYSFDDFELDDDDSLLVTPVKPSLSTQPPRPSLQPNLAAPAKPPLKPTISSQPANQVRLKPQTAPPGQIAAQSRPTGAAQAQAPLQSAKSKPTVTATAQLKPTTATSSKPVLSTSSQLKTPVSAASQPKPVSPLTQPKPSTSASPLLKTAGVNVTKQFAPADPQPTSSAATETKPAAAKADDASVPQKTENAPSQENEKCKSTANSQSSLPASSLPSTERPDDTKKCEESSADTTPNSSADYKSKTAKTTEKTENRYQDSEAKPQDAATLLSDASLQKEVKKLKEADKDSTQTTIDAGQKHFGPVACGGCGMLYSAANPEDEAQHLLFHNQFISAVKYVGWKKERILAEYPDGKIILVLPDDPKYALKKVEEIREMVDNDLGFQQVETKCPSKTKTFLFISIDKKVAGCLIAEHIQEGYRVIEEPPPEGSEGEKVLFERQKAWCCSTSPEPAICGISRIWVASMMRRQGIATRMIECLRNNFIYGSYLRKDEIAFSDPTPDGKLFASHYFGTSQFLVYNFVSGPRSFQPKTQAV